MATYTLSPYTKKQFFDDSGNPLSSGRVYTFEDGTSTPLTTYMTKDGTEWGAFVQLDSAGRPQNGEIYLEPGRSYKFILRDVNGVDIWTQSGIEGVPMLARFVEILYTAGESIGIGQSIYLSKGDGGKTPGRWYLTDADLLYASILPVVAIATTAASAGQQGSATWTGTTTPNQVLLTGADYFLSGTAGALASTPGTYARYMGRAVSTSQLELAANPRTADVVFNVLDFGATGNGTTNDRAAIQAAIDAASASFAGVVFFPTGNYLVNVSSNRGLIITKAVSLVGASATSSIIFGGGFTTADIIVDIDGTVSPNLHHVNLSNLTVMSNDSGRPDLISVNRAANCAFTDIFLRAGRHGITITGDRTFTLDFERVICTSGALTGDVIRFNNAAGGQFTFSDCSFTGLIGVNATGASLVVDDLVFNNCNFESCGTAATFTSTGTVRGVSFFGGRCEKNSAPIAFAPGVAGVLLNVAIDGMTFETDAENFAVDCGGAGTLAGISIQNCFSRDYAQYFVRMTNGSGGAIINNTLNNVTTTVVSADRPGVLVLNNRTSAAAATGPQWAAVWTTPTFSAGNFTANASMTWTVASGDVVTYAYQVIGKMMTVAWYITTSTVGGTPSTELRIAIPNSAIATKFMATTFIAVDNAAAQEVGLASVTVGSAFIGLSLLDATNWAAATDATAVYGQITFEINNP